MSQTWNKLVRAAYTLQNSVQIKTKLLHSRLMNSVLGVTLSGAIVGRLKARE
jgi:hypothetical protein